MSTVVTISQMTFSGQFCPVNFFFTLSDQTSCLGNVRTFSVAHCTESVLNSEVSWFQGYLYITLRTSRSVLIIQGVLISGCAHSGVPLYFMLCYVGMPVDPWSGGSLPSFPHALHHHHGGHHLGHAAKGSTGQCMHVWVHTYAAPRGQSAYTAVRGQSAYNCTQGSKYIPTGLPARKWMRHNVIVSVNSVQQTFL